MTLKSYRPNVAALVRCGDMYIACLRNKFPGWQCVQGGIDDDDKSPEHAIIREMKEELGVAAENIRITYRSRYWRRYDFLTQKSKRSENFCGQEQMWFVVEIDSIMSIDLKQALSDEFTNIQAMTISELVEKYVKWKHQPFYDFCRELQLI